MLLSTRQRAFEMLRKPSLRAYRHLPKVYVLGERLFAFEAVALEYQREFDHKHRLEAVTIEEAYRVKTQDELPREVIVDNNINKEVEYEHKKPM